MASANCYNWLYCSVHHYTCSIYTCFTLLNYYIYINIESSMICRGSISFNNNLYCCHAYHMLQAYYVINLFIYSCSFKFHFLSFQGLMKTIFYPSLSSHGTLSRLFSILLALYLHNNGIGITGSNCISLLLTGTFIWDQSISNVSQMKF